MKVSACSFVARQIVVLAIVSVALLAVGIDDSIAQSKPNGSMLYFFTSDGCAPCIQVKHNIEQLANEGYPVTTINVNERPDWANRFRVTRTPTVVLVKSNFVEGFHPGQIRTSELREWFRLVGFAPGRRPVGSERTTTTSDAIAKPAVRPQSVVASSTSRPTALPRQTKVSINRDSHSKVSSGSFRSDTMHRGTNRPGNAAEALALNSTVRIRVEDAGGSSYATGTAIHRHQGETLVMTCGHVFRESKGKGTISAEFGFNTGNIKRVSGQLLDYDSGANDIALVVIQNGQHEIPTVNVADSNSRIERSDRVFSLGCDNGDDPTIRNTAIKNLALYDGSLKYDIFGRPVNGRSGGGLFNAQGELIGICNAAAVEVDEGVYTALEIVHKQLAKTNLSHLFEPSGIQSFEANNQIANRSQPSRSRSDALVPIGSSPTQSTETPNRLAAAPPVRSFQAPPASQVQNVSFEQAVSNLDSDQEVIITIRSKSNPSNSRTITISDPTPKLLDYLDGMESGQPNPHRSLDVASYRAQN